MSTLFGRRVLLRPLVPSDFGAWQEVRRRNAEWLTKWEAARIAGAPDPVEDKSSFDARCAARQRERMLGTGFGFGLFVDGRFSGEINLNTIQRGPFQNAYVGYWIDEALRRQEPHVRGGGGARQVRLRRAAPPPHPDLDHPPQPQQPPGDGEARHPRGGHGPALPRDQRRLGGPRPLRHDRRGVGGAPRGAPPRLGRLGRPSGRVNAVLAGGDAPGCVLGLGCAGGSLRPRSLPGTPPIRRSTTAPIRSASHRAHLLGVQAWFRGSSGRR